MANEPTEELAAEKTTQALMALFIRVVALETVLIGQKTIDPKTLAEATVKAMIKFEEFNKAQEKNEEDNSGV